MLRKDNFASINFLPEVQVELREAISMTFLPLQDITEVGSLATPNRTTLTTLTSVIAAMQDDDFIALEGQEDGVDIVYLRYRATINSPEIWTFYSERLYCEWRDSNRFSD